MDDDTFMGRYHRYQAATRAEAEAEAETITLTDGQHPVVVAFPFGESTRFALMLPRAAWALFQHFPELRAAAEGER